MAFLPTTTMRSLTKIIGLSLILGSPLIIYILLQSLGENKFTIPVFHQNGLKAIASCPQSDSTHHVPDFSFTTTNNTRFTEQAITNQNIIFYIFPTPCNDSCRRVMEALTRIQHEFSDDEVQLISLSADSSPAYQDTLKTTYFVNQDQWKFLTGSFNEVKDFGLCSLGLKALENIAKNEQPYAHKLVLVDGKGRIRGYYQGAEREEVDRLFVELRILLKETVSSGNI